MAKRRTKLIAARIEAGFDTQDALVKSLRDEGVLILSTTYANIESGRNKNVDVQLACAICCKIGRSVEEIFLPRTMQKLHRKYSIILPRTG